MTMLWVRACATVNPQMSLPADLVSSVNITTLSGEQTIDSVATSASRVLLTTQATSSQNGPWITSTGSWSRPTDFSTDAQVIPGDLTYVKNGTLGSGTNWQLISGSTIAGAKTFQRVVLQQHPDVRLVQTAALPAYGYSSGVVTATSNGMLATTYFDGVTPALNDAVLLNLEGTHNGPYLCTQVGDGSHPFKFTRRSDGDSSSDFYGGLTVNVLDGTLYKGTSWALQNQGVITLDTNSLTFVQLVEHPYIEVDMAKQYGLRVYADSSTAFIAWRDQGQPDAGKAITQASYDYRGRNVRLRYPSGGYIHCATPPSLYFARQGVNNINTIHIGGGSDKTTLSFAGAGGHGVNSCSTAPPTYGPTIDTGANRISLALWDTTVNNPVQDPYFNLSHAGLCIGDNKLFINNPGCDLAKGLKNFDVAFEGRPFEFFVANVEHLVSCRGRRLLGDALDTCFAIYCDSNLKQVVATLRTYDATAGAYGSVTKTGSAGTSVVTGDGTIKPNWDTTWMIYVEVGGTVGTADSKSVKFSFDGGANWSSSQLIGAATSLTIQRTFTRLFGGLITAKFNFGAGTLGAGDLYTCTSSGCNQTQTLASGSNTLTAGTNYQIRLWYNGTTFALYLNAFGMTNRTAPIASVGMTGMVRQYPWEQTHLGRPYNFGQRYGATDLPASHWYFAGLRIIGDNVGSSNSSVVAPATTVETTLVQAYNRTGGEPLTGQVYWWGPNSVEAQNLPTGFNGGGVQTGPDGVVNHFTAELWDLPVLIGISWIKPLRNLSYDFSAFLEVHAMSSFPGVVRASGFYLGNTENSRFSDLNVPQGFGGFDIAGPSFFCSFDRIRASCVDYNMVVVAAAFVMLGHWVFDGGRIGLYFSGANHSGQIEGRACNFEFNTEVGPPNGTLCTLTIDGTDGGGLTIGFIDDENGAVPNSSISGDELIRVAVNPGYAFELTGPVGSGLLPTTPVAVGTTDNVGTAGLAGTLIWNGTMSAEQTCSQFFRIIPSAYAEKRALVRARPGARMRAFGSSSVMLANRPNMVVLERGGISEGTPLGDASATLIGTDGEQHVLSIPLTANRTYTAGKNGQVDQFAQTNVLEGAVKIFDLMDNTSSFTAAIADEVSGTILYTKPAGKLARVSLKFKLTTAFPRGQWQLDGPPVVA